VVAESGQILKAGDVILELSNLNREIQVLSQEAALSESINRNRETRLQITQNETTQRTDLATIDNQLAVFGPQYERQKTLFEKKLISKQEFEKTEADYNLALARKKFTYAAYRADSMDRGRQLASIAHLEDRMSLNLEGVGKILDALVIKAPIDGQLQRPQLDPGQSIAPGQRMGQIDELGRYKVKVPIDELYLPRIQTGLKATTTFNNKEYELEIKYKYTNITAGRFDVDMMFTGETPPGLLRGLSLRLRIELGQASEELLLPVGGFYKDTGGNWVFVIEEGNRAVKRDIKLGRKMGSEYFEVLEGLKPGDKVITSSYENFGNNEVLLLD
jgi:HlyD family secretion protein